MTDEDPRRQNPTISVDSRIRAAFALGLFCLVVIVIFLGFLYPNYTAPPAIVGALVTAIVGLLATGRL